MVSRPGWVPGNTIAFLITGSGHRTAESFDKSGGAPPVLTVTFLTPTLRFSATNSVSSGTNDAEQAVSGAVNLTSTDLELVNDGALGDQVVGLRFENLGLPPGAFIANASLQFSTDETESNPANLTLFAQAADFAPGFTASANDLGARPLTSASVAWSPAPWTIVGERGSLQRTPDLSTLVQEIVARPGWTNGGALAFLISGAGRRTADSADKSGGSPAALTVGYSLEIPLGTYARWAAGRVDGASPADDPDGDGYSNLLEYSLGLDPTMPDWRAFDFTTDGTQLTLAWRRPSAALGVAIQVEWCDDLLTGAWNSDGVATQIIADDGVTRSLRTMLPAGTAGKRFVRLKATLQ